MFKKMPFILLGVILLAWILSYFLPVPYLAVLYGVSLSLKALIIFVLPLLIFGLLFKTAAQIAKKATKIILLILVAICLSNFLSTLLSYGVGHAAYKFDLSMQSPQGLKELQPAWTLVLPKWIGNGLAMFLGLILGVLIGKGKPRLAERIAFYLDKGIQKILQGILYVIPLFIAGFVVKLSYDRVLDQILRNYALIFLVIAIAVFSYIALLYLVANKFQGRSWLKSIKNMLPAAISGFGSMSSAATMPLTILGTEKNAKNPNIARSLIPVTVNVHLIGDCFAIPIFAFAILKSFGFIEPAFSSYLIFALYFVLAKFSVAAVPGGGILVMLPIIESTLGFNAEMLSLITALYILFDPVITCANVLGNGGFALLIDRFFKGRWNL